MASIATGGDSRGTKSDRGNDTFNVCRNVDLEVNYNFKSSKLVINSYCLRI